MPPETQTTQPQGTQPSAPSSAPSPQNQPQASQPQAQQLDPSVVALTKSIGKAESGGNYNAGDNTGDGAASSGAYQMTPSFLQEWAPAAGVQYQPGSQLTPAQQDQIAYNAVKTMGTTGDPAYPELGKLDPAQITSAWNTGNPDAYLDPSYGTNNEYGSTQNYVNEVAKNYDASMGNSQSTTSSTQNSSTSSQASSLLDALGGGIAAGGAWLLSEAAKPLADAATDAAVGATVGSVLPGEGTVAGGVGGAIAGTAEGVIQDLTGSGGGNDNSNTQPQSTSSDYESQPQNQEAPQTSATEPESENAVAASTALKDAINQTVGGTQSGRVFTSTQAGQDAVNTAAQFGLVEPDENGNLTFNSAKLAQLENAVEEGKDGVIASQENATNSPLAVANYAGNYIGRDRINTAADKQKAAQIVQSELAADSGGIPMDGQMSLADMRKAQKTHYQAAKASYSNPKPNAEMMAHKAIAQGYGRAIRDKISEEDKPLYDKLTKASRDLTNVKQLKKKVEGKKAPKSKGLWESFLRQGARAAEIYIGEKLGGPIGAILGGLAGEHLNNKITQRFGRNVFETKGMKAALNLLHDTKPKAYENLIAELKKRGEKVPENVIYASEAKKPEGKKGLIELIKKDETNMSKGKKISGKSTGFPAKAPQAPPSEALKALMQRHNPPTKGLVELRKPLPVSQRKGQIRGLVSLKR